MSEKAPDHQTPPPPELLLVVYGVLGTAASFLFGHKPGHIPESLVAEVCPSIIVICLFLVTYSVYDVMGCGVARALHQDMAKKDDKDTTVNGVPEIIHLAERAQANQVEQMASFLVSTLCFSVLVNGKIGAGLALVWSILRRLYASTYRNSVGIPMNQKGLALYTIPCYFIIDTMLMGSAVQGIRWILLTEM